MDPLPRLGFELIISLQHDSYNKKSFAIFFGKFNSKILLNFHAHKLSTRQI